MVRKINPAAIPFTDLPVKDRVPDVVGIGLGDSAEFVAGILGGHAISGPVQHISMQASEAVISPANTKGYMGGKIQGANIDAAYLEMFGQQIQDRVQARIKTLFQRDSMPLGYAFMLRTFANELPIPKGKPGWLIVAPTIVLQSVGMPKAMPDVAGKALEAALIIAGLAGVTKIYVPAMGMGSTGGASYLRHEFKKSFGNAYDNTDEYLYNKSTMPGKQL